MRFRFPFGRALAVGLPALTLSICAVQPAGAGVIFQSLPSLTGGTVTVVPNSYGPYHVSDSFTLTSAATISEVDFAEYDTNGNATLPSSVTLSIFANNGGVPGASLFSQTLTPTAGVSAEASNGGGTIQVEDFFPTGLQLAAGTYWISPYSPGSTPFTVAAFSNPGGDLYQSGGHGTFADTSAGFALIGSSAPVPEPASLSLLGAGLGALGWMRRRR